MQTFWAIKMKYISPVDKKPCTGYHSIWGTQSNFTAIDDYVHRLNESEERNPVNRHSKTKYYITEVTPTAKYKMANGDICYGLPGSTNTHELHYMDVKEYKIMLLGRIIGRCFYSSKLHVQDILDDLIKNHQHTQNIRLWFVRHHR